MNRHFEDTVYYLKRAGTTVKRGVLAELEPLTSRVQSVTRRDSESESGRAETVRERLASARTRAEREGKKVVGEARETVGQYRGT